MKHVFRHVKPTLKSEPKAEPREFLTNCTKHLELLQASDHIWLYTSHTPGCMIHLGARVVVRLNQTLAAVPRVIGAAAQKEAWPYSRLAI